LVQRYPSAGLPRALPPSPTLEQVIQVVNRNSSQIQSFHTTHATFSGPGFPTLRANVAFQRPRRLRLRADLMSWPELDLGSNDELFWFWIKRGQPAAVFFCRHDLFPTSRARQMIPIEPDWLIEAVGITEFDPALPHQGPFALPGGRLEVRTIRESLQGPTTKITVLDAAQGWVLEQRLLDCQGRLLAASITGNHRADPLTGLVVPGLVQINCPPAQFTMRIDLGNVQINRLAGNPDELWALPMYPGYPQIDLGDPRFEYPPAVGVAPPPAVPMGTRLPAQPAYAPPRP
jgi:hypothetical protein